MKELMGRAGHSTPRVATHYQKASQERDAALADRMSQLYRSADGTSGLDESREKA